MNQSNSETEAGPGETPKRVQVNIIMAIKTRELITKLASDEGVSLGRACETLIERCLTYDRVVEAMARDLQTIRSGHLDEALRSQGYRPMKTPYGRAWVPARYPVTRGFEAGAGKVGEGRVGTDIVEE
jgi:hypothetical protein